MNLFDVLSRCEAGASMLNEADPLLLPEVKISASGENDDDSLEREEELGIFQVIDRLEEATNKLIR